MERTEETGKLKCGCVRGYFLCEEAVLLWQEITMAYVRKDWPGYDKAQDAYNQHFGTKTEPVKPMKLKVKVLKPFRHGCRVFEVGEMGTITEVDYPLTWSGQPIYDFYVNFHGYEGVGVHKEDVEVLND